MVKSCPKTVLGCRQAARTTATSRLCPRLVRREGLVLAGVVEIVGCMESPFRGKSPEGILERCVEVTVH
jgi:hypothetical protein